MAKLQISRVQKVELDRDLRLFRDDRNPYKFYNRLYMRAYFTFEEDGEVFEDDIAVWASSEDFKKGKGFILGEVSQLINDDEKDGDFTIADTGEKEDFIEWAKEGLLKELMVKACYMSRVLDDGTEWYVVFPHRVEKIGFIGE